MNAWRFPSAVGRNVTVIVQLSSCARVPLQLLVCLKSPAWAPPIVTLLITIFAASSLVSVTTFALLEVLRRCIPNLSDTGFMVGGEHRLVITVKAELRGDVP